MPRKAHSPARRPASQTMLALALPAAFACLSTLSPPTLAQESAASSYRLRVPVKGLAVQTTPTLGPANVVSDVTELNFGSLLAGESAYLSVTLTNQGESVATLGTPTLTPSSAGFTLGQQCPASLAPQASCSTSVLFSSLSPGAHSATLEIASNSPSGPLRVSLVANSLNPYEIALNANSVRTYRNGELAESCKAYRNPTAPYTYSGSTGSGIYRVRVAGQEGNVYCDMDTNGGGYTVIQSVKDSRHFGTPYAQATDAAPPQPNNNTSTYLPKALAVALANVATEVRVQELGTSKFVSSSHATVMGNLRAGRLTNYTTATSSDYGSMWYQSQAGLAPMNATCATAASGETIYNTYPSVFWACGNTSGFHLGVDAPGKGNASWRYLTANGPLVVSYR